MGFKYWQCDDGRKFLMGHSDIVAARATLPKQTYNMGYADSSYISYNIQLLNMSSSSGRFKLPGSRGGSAVGGFIPESRFIFYSKLKSNVR
jgi:hypothetical protein